MSRKGAGSNSASKTVLPSASSTRTPSPQISDASCHCGSRSTILPLTRAPAPVTRSADSGSSTRDSLLPSRYTTVRTGQSSSRNTPLPEGFHHPSADGPVCTCWKRGWNARGVVVPHVVVDRRNLGLEVAGEDQPRQVERGHDSSSGSESPLPLTFSGTGTFVRASSSVNGGQATTQPAPGTHTIPSAGRREPLG